MLILAKTRDQREQAKLQHRCRLGELTRLRAGIYVPTEQFSALPRWDRYKIHCLAAAVSKPKHFLTGKSAAALWEIPYGSVPQWIEMGSTTSRSTITAPLIKLRRPTFLPGQGLHRLAPPFETGQVTSIQQTLLDLARWHPLEDGVQSIDHCLHNRLVTLRELEALLPALRGRLGVGRALKAVELSHPAAESPRESLIRLRLWEAGLPAPYLQATISDRYGKVVGRTDYFYPGVSIGLEYDGEGKYQAQFGVTPAETAEAEMLRTKKMGNTGILLVRITRQTYIDGSWLDDVKEALERGRQRGLVFPASQWTSAGIAWHRAKYGSRPG